MALIPVEIPARFPTLPLISSRPFTPNIIILPTHAYTSTAMMTLKNACPLRTVISTVLSGWKSIQPSPCKKVLTGLNELPGPLLQAGMKVRVQNSIMSMEMVKAMGGSPTPVPWGELYTALDQGVVDAAENNPPSFRTSRHYEVCRYYVLDEHTRLPDILVISTRVWNSLSSEFQQVLQEAVDESVEYQQQIWAEAEEKDMKEVQDAGVKVIRPDKEPFRASVKSVWDQFDGTDIGELIRQIQEVK